MPPPDSELAWPLNSPLSVGFGVAVLAIFLLGLAFAIIPNFITRSKNSHLREYDKRMGRVVMAVTGPAFVCIMFLSWWRSNNARYAWLYK